MAARAWLVEYMKNTISDANAGYLQDDDAEDCAEHIERYLALDHADDRVG